VSAINDVDSRLALELAIEISEIPDIMERYGLTKAQLAAKLDNPAFKAMVRDYRISWKSDLSVKERIRIKSMVLVEDSLLELYTIFHDKELSANARLDAFKSMSKVATVDAPDREGHQAGERVSININIPGVERPTVVFDGEVVQEEHDG
jgi:hypothetical protein